MAPEISLKLDGFARVLPILRWVPGYEAGWFPFRCHYRINAVGNWHRRDDRSSWRIGRLAGVKLTLSNNSRISAVDPFRTSVEGRRRPTGGNSTAARQIRRAAGLYFKRKWCAGRCSLGRTGRRPVLGSRLAVPEGASGSVGLKVAWQRGEKWLWQIVQVAPFPSFNMIRFSHFRLAA